MKHICPFIFLLFIGLSNTFLFAQSEDEFFHKAGFEYYKADYPKAHKIVVNGLEKYNSSEKLTKLKELICEQWPGCEGTPPPSPPCLDQDGDGICDEVDPCPDDETNSCGQIGCDSDRDNDGICDEDDQCPDDAGIPHPVNNGCPKDSDGDGIWDMYDKCPDKRGQRNHSGCPDTDGDGVYDDVDRCDSDPGPSSNNGCPEAEPTVPGCTDRSADNYNSNATTPCRNCCRYTINTNFKRVPGQNKMTWNPELAQKATSIRITYTIKPVDGNNETLVNEVVTGQSSHLYDPQTWKADQIETDVRLIISIDSKITVVGSKLKQDELFDCSSN